MEETIPSEERGSSQKSSLKTVSLRAFLTRLIWLCVAPLVLLTIYLVINHTWALKHQSDALAIDLAQNVANMVDQDLSNQITSLRALASSPFLDSPENYAAFYNRARAFHELFGHHMILVDSSMRMLMNTRTSFGVGLPKLPTPKGFAAAPHALETGQPAVGDTFYDPIANEPLVALVVPVIRYKEIRFLLLYAVETSHFQKLIDRVVLPDQWSLSLVDGTGAVIASRGGKITLPQIEEGQKDGLFEVKSEFSKWSVLLEVPFNYYSDNIISSTLFLSFAVLAALCVGIFGGRMAGRGLSRSVAALSASPLPESSNPLITEIEEVRSRLTEAIAARELSETSKIESERRFRVLFDAAPIPISYVGIDGSYTEVNERFVKVFGYNREEVKTLSAWRELAYPDENYRNYIAKTWQEALEKAIYQKTDIPQIESHVRCKNGEVRIMLISGVVLGEGFLTTFFDITERKKFEKALYDSEERFRILAEGAFEGVVISRDGKFLDFNEVFSRMTGYRLDELVGSDVQNLVVPELREIAQEHLRTNSQEPYESVILRKDGTRIPVQISAKIMPYEGLPSRLTAVRDIGAIKKAEEVQRRLATAITQAAEAILITDVQGIIQYVNPALERSSGFSSRELLGKTPSIFQSGQHPQSFYQDLWKTVKAGKIWSGRFTNRRKDGSIYFEDATISPVRDGSGNIINFVAVKRDVTEYLSLTAQLFQAQKMEAIGTLTGGIAHDFNNILQVCLGYSELLIEDQRLSKNLKDDARNIFEAARKGADLAKRLLTFSRKTDARPIILNLNQRINEMKKMLARTIPKNIKIDLILSENLAMINADPIQMDQVIMNVVVNARDAMRDGGILTIETSNVVLDEEYANTHLHVAPGQYVLLMITDTGIGMDEQTASRIFEPFFTTKELGQGTGLGLSVVFGIVQQHGGFIRYYSNPGYGTTCKIYFPALVSQQQIDVEDPKPMPSGGSETIMVVDDEDQILDLLSKALRNSGYEVLVARNGREAIEEFVRHKDRISAIVLDLIMPEMDGSECLDKLLNMDPSVKVLVSSGFSANGKAKNILNTGAKGFITKPFDINHILIKIRDILDEKR